MERMITTSNLRSKLTAILDQVQFHSDSYLIERQGKPSVAIVPVHVYENWKRERAQFLGVLRKGQEGNEHLDEDEAMDIVLEAQQAVRAEMENEQNVP